MRGRTVAFWVAVVALIGTGAYLLLWGGQSEELVSGTAVSQAAERTTDKGTAHMTIAATVSTEVDGQGVFMQMNGDGDMDFRRQAAALSMHASMPIAGSASGTTIEMEEVFDDYVVYLRSPQFASELPGGKEWMSMDLNAIGKRMGVDFQQLSGLGTSGDPAQMLDQLRAVSDQIQRSGEEDVDGVPTTHYVATIDLNRYPALARPADRAAVKASIDQLTQLGAASRMPIDVWIDGNHLVRRVRMDLSQDNPATGSPMKMTMQIDMSDFGRPVSVQVPPASETIDVQGLLGSSYGSVFSG